ncbi:hypothetical protein Dsin_000395 [Dipteronia sinensis]|uniref:Uncharacterized protein n=1 Tax=Dipteronia sinensis TaxID=43782 RepID=A0AAE0B3L0_9ROSI|nr:hypothetical protein Dsin_000395 [Dipteronia sinensis]
MDHFEDHCVEFGEAGERIKNAGDKPQLVGDYIRILELSKMSTKEEYVLRTTMMGFPQFCTYCPDKLWLVVNFLTEILSCEIDSRDVYEALLPLVKQDTKVSLTTFFENISSLIKTDARKKVFTSKTSLLNHREEIERHVIDLIKGVLRTTMMRFPQFCTYCPDKLWLVVNFLAEILSCVSLTTFFEIISSLIKTDALEKVFTSKTSLLNHREEIEWHVIDLIKGVLRTTMMGFPQFCTYCPDKLWLVVNFLAEILSCEIDSRDVYEALLPLVKQDTKGFH